MKTRILNVCRAAALVAGLLAAAASTGCWDSYTPGMDYALNAVGQLLK
ncbi:MAG: hypothetical protein U1A27_01955 [Phycisphaerae bacterium]